jgi:hypothetical protein
MARDFLASDSPYNRGHQQTRYPSQSLPSNLDPALLEHNSAPMGYLGKLHHFCRLSSSLTVYRLLEPLQHANEWPSSPSPVEPEQFRLRKPKPGLRRVC